MATAELPDDWMRFIQESEALTGIVPFDPDHSSTRRHISICIILARAANFLDPRLINGLINGKHWEFTSLLRTGTEEKLRGLIPDAPQMRVLLEAWLVEAQAGTRNLQTASDAIKAEFAWKMHDRLTCIHPFKTGNGRTARLMLNHLRGLLGLPVHVISDQEASKYASRLRTYREEVFLPSLAQA